MVRFVQLKNTILTIALSMWFVGNPAVGQSASGTSDSTLQVGDDFFDCVSKGNRACRFIGTPQRMSVSTGSGTVPWKPCWDIPKIPGYEFVPALSRLVKISEFGRAPVDVGPLIFSSIENPSQVCVAITIRTTDEFGKGQLEYSIVMGFVSK